ncbi:hypothetical protein H9P43_007442 [Blastocladiella emersonii ATCC 22665]|nr:hypothetical protein H9P43_007442 [Blastocladiella emersonii ATCC 22665]
MAFRLPFHAREDDYMNEDAPYPAVTLRERRLLGLLGAIRNKVQWAAKAQDPAIAAKWRAELAAQGAASEDALHYVFDEIAYTAVHAPTMAGADNVHAIDDLLPEAERARLAALVAAQLEDAVPESKKDWHPRSGNQVLDLVHPSLYPLVYGFTRVVAREHAARSVEESVARAFEDPAAMGGKLAVPPAAADSDEFVSEQFQWLPADIEVDATGRAARFVSYINNLHPHDHGELYGMLEQVVSAMLPLFEQTLARIEHPFPLRIHASAREWYPHRYDANGREIWPDSENGLDDDEFYERQPVQPAVPAAFDPAWCAVPKAPSLAGRRLQVIVKLANIHLTPERPHYAGGSWHVEGMENESIVATGLYYYDVANITESRLHFRTAIRGPDYEQSDYMGMEQIYGLSNEDWLSQECGHIVAEQGRGVCFPNLYQHRVAPFSLADPTRQGHRKIVAVFLVDPERSEPVPSTAVVAPQQASWLARAVLAQPEHWLTAALPTELVEAVADQVPSRMTLGAAKKHRLALMDERTGFASVSTELTYSAPFNLCEH